MTDRFGTELDVHESDGPFVLTCKQCGQVFSGPLRRLLNPEQIRHEGGEPALPVGFFAIGGDMFGNDAYYGATASGVLVGLADLFGLNEFGPRVGCCGPSDYRLNLRCKNGHPIGIEVSDCWTPHFVHFPIEGISITSESKVGS
jgi:hypothetical protein